MQPKLNKYEKFILLMPWSYSYTVMSQAQHLTFTGLALAYGHYHVKPIHAVQTGQLKSVRTELLAENEPQTQHEENAVPCYMTARKS